MKNYFKSVDSAMQNLSARLDVVTDELSQAVPATGGVIHKTKHVTAAATGNPPTDHSLFLED